MNYALHVCFGFYIYDIFYIFQCIRAATGSASSSAQIRRQHAPYILHHLIAMYLLYDTITTPYNTGPLLESYYFLEASNVLLYLSYHIHKEYPSHQSLISFTEFAQLLWYSYYRVYRFSMLLYYNQPRFFEFTRVSQVAIIVIYVMGVAWTCKLAKRNIGNYTNR